MAHGSYEDQKKLVFYGLKLLGIITIVEVIFALFFNGHIIEGFHKAHLGGHTLTVILAVVYGLIMVGFSLYKAKFIVYNFMHMGSEVRGLRLSVLMPMLLLVWAIIAFFQEGSSWGARREQIHQKDKQEATPSTGSLDYDIETYQIIG